MLACSKWKMRIRKFLLVVPLLLGFLFVSDTSAFAQDIPEGVDVGEDFLLGKVGKACGKDVTQMTDGDDSTFHQFTKACRDVYYTFDSPVNIAGFMFLKANQERSYVLISFFDSEGNQLSGTTSWDDEDKGKFIKVNAKKVKSMKIDNGFYNDSLKISSLQVYGKMVVKSPNITELKESSITHNSVKFSYKLPKGHSLKVLRDNKVIANDVKVEEFVDKGLEANTEYNYKFISYAPDYGESNGVDLKVKTLETPNLSKPVKPSNLMITPKDGSLLVNLVDYNAGVKIKGYHIIVDGKQVNDSLVTGRSYAVKGLKNGQTYQVQIKAVSAWNVESDLSNSVPGIPQVQVIPDIAFNFGLSDLMESIKNWFGGIWPIVAFSIAIPLAFIVAFNTKKLFLR